MNCLEGIDAAAAVDLTQIPCNGCQYVSVKVCKRFPPVFTAPVPHPHIEKKMMGGGWAFPPAILKCGEFKPSE